MSGKSFSEMSHKELLAARRDHQRRLDSGRGTDTYRELLRAALRGIDAELNNGT